MRNGKLNSSLEDSIIQRFSKLKGPVAINQIVNEFQEDKDIPKAETREAIRKLIESNKIKLNINLELEQINNAD